LQFILLILIFRLSLTVDVSWLFYVDVTSIFTTVHHFLISLGSNSNPLFEMYVTFLGWRRTESCSAECIL
jgi:hypothetical protein